VHQVHSCARGAGSDAGPSTCLAFVGIHFDPEDLRRRLETCLLTARELRAGRDIWQALEDPFPPWGLSRTAHRRPMHH
jgi:hypothetical protein